MVRYYPRLVVTSETSAYLDFSDLKYEIDRGYISYFSFDELKIAIMGAIANETYSVTLRINGTDYSDTYTTRTSANINRSVVANGLNIYTNMLSNYRISISVSYRNNNKIQFNEWQNTQSIRGGTSSIIGSSVINNFLPPTSISVTRDLSKQVVASVTPSSYGDCRGLYYYLKEKVSGSWSFIESNNILGATSLTFEGNKFKVGTEYQLNVAYSYYLQYNNEYLKSGKNVIIEISDFYIPSPTITNLEVAENNIDYPIKLTWRATNQSGYEVEVYQNNILVHTQSERTTQSTCTIPTGKITSTSNIQFRVRLYYINQYDAANPIYSNWLDRNATMTRIVPSISNLNVVDLFWEKDINSNWRSENQTKYEYEIWQNNVRTRQYTGTGNAIVIPAGHIPTGGDTSFRVRPIYVPSWSTTDVSIGQWVERTVTLRDIQATVSNLSLSGSNVDLGITFSWTSTDQQNYEVQVIKDTVTKSYSGTTATSVNIPPSTLTVGLYKFKVRIAYKDRWTPWQELNATLTETLPSIGVLWPDGVLVERDEPIRIWWTSQNKSKWKLVVDDVTTYTGTDENEKILSAGLLQTGKHKIQLTVTFITVGGLEKHTSKIAEFIVQGKPPIPTILGDSVFDTSRPKFTWDTQDQQGYILDVLKNNIVIYSTDWQNGLVVEHKVMDYLKNGMYTLRIKTMNQYGLQSDWGTKQITINATEIETIELNSIVLINNVQLDWDNKNSKFTHFYVIRNDVVIAKVLGTSYIDHTAHRECIYYVRGITATDIYKDSNSVYEEVIINRSVLATIDNLEDSINIVVMTPDDRFSGNLGLECDYVNLSGREHPVAIWGEHSGNSYNLKLSHCDEPWKFVEMFKRRKVFCYRDNFEKLFFTIQKLPYTRDSMAIDFEATIAATQVNYSEVVEYD